MDIHYRPKIVDSVTHYSGKRISVRADTVDCEGDLVVREVVEHPGAVAIIPIHENGSVTLIRQFRHPLNEVLYEVVAGTLELNENPLGCAKRELAEEARLEAQELIHLGSIYTTPGFSSEKIHLYAATGLSQAFAKRDVGEFMEVHELSQKRVSSMIESSEICDAKTLACCLYAARRGLIEL